MDGSDELIQINVTVGDSVLELLPEMMRVLTNARNSTYSWHSMNVSLYTKANVELALKLTKDTSNECETIKGELVTVNDDSLSMINPPQVLAEISMSGYREKTMRDYLNETSKPQTCASTISITKELSNEVFYPSWYDRVRMVSDSAVLGSMIPPSITISTINLHNLVSTSSNNENQKILPLNGKTSREASDETLRLKRIRDMAHKSVFKANDIAALEEVTRLHTRVLSSMSCNSVQISCSDSPQGPDETVVTNNVLEFQSVPLSIRRNTAATVSIADGGDTQNYQWYYCCDGLTGFPKTEVRKQDKFTEEKSVTLESDSEESKLSSSLLEKNHELNTDKDVVKRTASTNVVTWLMNNDLHRMVDNECFDKNLEMNKKKNNNKSETEEMDLLGRGDTKKLELVASEDLFNVGDACGDKFKRDKRRHHRSDKRKKKDNAVETSVKTDLNQDEPKTKYLERDVTRLQKLPQGHLSRKAEKMDLSEEHSHLHREGKSQNKGERMKKSKILDDEYRHRDHNSRESPRNELQHPKSPALEKECKRNTKSIDEHDSTVNINKADDRSKWKRFVMRKRQNGDDTRDDSTSSTALSFFELVSIMKSEVRQLGRKSKEDKKNRCKDT